MLITSILLYIGLIALIILAIFLSKKNLEYGVILGILASAIFILLASISTLAFEDNSESDSYYCVICSKLCSENKICDNCLEDFVEWVEDNNKNES